MHLTGVDNVIK